MLQLTLLELFTRTIPEGMIFIFAGYVFSNKPLDMKKLAFSGALLGLGTYCIRHLPIHFGIHTILNLLMHMALLVWINNIEFSQAISTALISIAILLVCEWVNILVVTEVFHIPTDFFLNKDLLRVLASIPSLLLFFLIVYLYYLRKNRKGS